MSAGSAGLDRAWIVSFTRHLPAELRTSIDDPKLIAAAVQARANGWDATTLATAVAARDYQGTLHPSLMATQRLHELGCIPPPPSTERPVSREDGPAHCGRYGCDCRHDRCFKGWIDSPARDRGSDTTQACRQCRPVLWQRVHDIPPPGGRSAGDMAHIRAERGRG